jgi:hypothetical protein
MSLINEMRVDNNGGVCLKKHRSYYTYDKKNIGGVYYDFTGYINENYATGEYILPYKNQNDNFIINIYDISVCLILKSGTTITDFAEYYINSIVTTGYTGYDGSEIENRVIYDSQTNNYYIFAYSGNTNTCGIDDNAKYAIVNKETFDLWDGTGNYYYVELDSCGVETGREIVVIMDINPISNTFKSIKYIEKAQNI